MNTSFTYDLPPHVYSLLPLFSAILHTIYPYALEAIVESQGLASDHRYFGRQTVA